MKDENTVQNELKVEISRLGGMPLRNNSGVLKDVDGTSVRFGLGNTSAKINKVRKTSDLIFPITITITPGMVGHDIAVFGCVEAKKEGWVYSGTETERGQFNFIDKVKRMGGISCFAQSVYDLRKAISEWVERFET